MTNSEDPPKNLSTRSYNEPYNPPHLPDLSKSLPSMDNYKSGQNSNIQELAGQNNFLKYTTGYSESYLQALRTFLESDGNKHIDPSSLEPTEINTMTENILKKIRTERGIKPEEFNLMLESFKSKRDEELSDHGGLAKLGIVVDKIKNSPVPQEMKTWVEAAQIQAEEALKNIAKFFNK